MLPVARKPIVQYVAEELIANRLDQILFVTGRNKTSIENHFDTDPELLRTLSAANRQDLLDETEFENHRAHFFYTRQRMQKGLGDAILCGENFAGEQPFVVALGDSILGLNAQSKAVLRMTELFESRHATCVIAVEEVPLAETSNYGVVNVEDASGDSFRVLDLVEKPRPEEAPSTLAIIGRYVLTPKIFEKLRQVRAITDLAQIAYVRQKEQLGLGHAVLMAKDLIGHEPFAVLLPDDVVIGDRPCIGQLIDTYQEHHGSVVAVAEVPREETSRYGVIAGEPVEGSDRTYRVSHLVEKPEPEDAPSNLAVIGRYVLTPKIFEKLEQTQRGAGGEIQLTDAIEALMDEQSVFGYAFEGDRYDAGTTMGWLQASVELALARPDTGREFREYLRTLDI